MDMLVRHHGLGANRRYPRTDLTSGWPVIRLESAQTSLQRFIRVRRSINESLGLGVFESRMRRSMSGLPSRVKDR